MLGVKPSVFFPQTKKKKKRASSSSPLLANMIDLLGKLSLHKLITAEKYRLSTGSLEPAVT